MPRVMRVSATGDQIMVDEPKQPGAALTRELALLGQVREAAGNLLANLDQTLVPAYVRNSPYVTALRDAIERSRRG